jgi:hypothetical protein
MSPPDVRCKRVVVETDRYRVEGDVTLPQEGYRNLLSDYMNHREEEILFLVNVEMVALDGSGRHWNLPVLRLARRQIRLFVPIDLPEVQKQN